MIDIALFWMFPRYFFLGSQKNISEKSPIFSAVEIPYGTYVGQTAGIFRRFLRYFPMFFAAERYFGDISDIQELQATFGCFKTSKNIGEVCRTLAFRGKLRHFRHFPRKKKYQILKNQKVRGCFKRHHVKKNIFRNCTCCSYCHHALVWTKYLMLFDPFIIIIIIIIIILILFNL